MTAAYGRLDGPEVINPRSDRVKAVRALSGRSSRVRAGRFLAEGPQSAREALRAHGAGRVRVVAAYGTYDFAERHEDILDLADDAGVAITAMSDEVAEAMSTAVTSQGVVVVAEIFEHVLADVMSGGPRLVAILSQVRDPGNAGTVIRAADAAGADAVILTDSSVDLFNPKVVRSTAGSLFHLPVVVGVSLVDAIGSVHDAGLQVLAADGAGELDLHQLPENAEPGVPSLGSPTAWVFGNEAWGMSETDRALADGVVRIPIYGEAESLNLGTAAAVCLYTSARALRR